MLEINLTSPESHQADELARAMIGVFVIAPDTPDLCEQALRDIDDFCQEHPAGTALVMLRLAIHTANTLLRAAGGDRDRQRELLARLDPSSRQSGAQHPPGD